MANCDIMCEQNNPWNPNFFASLNAPLRDMSLDIPDGDLPLLDELNIEEYVCPPPLQDNSVVLPTRQQSQGFDKSFETFSEIVAISNEAHNRSSNTLTMTIEDDESGHESASSLSDSENEDTDEDSIINSLPPLPTKSETLTPRTTLTLPHTPPPSPTPSGYHSQEDESSYEDTAYVVQTANRRKRRLLSPTPSTSSSTSRRMSSFEHRRDCRGPRHHNLDEILMKKFSSDDLVANGKAWRQMLNTREVNFEERARLKELRRRALSRTYSARYRHKTLAAQKRGSSVKRIGSTNVGRVPRS
eukprot:m.334579 g.334579  ORF g.334579 m.334579 type:complete len:301 (+) comp17387_c0_seq1:505-1407(+)